MERYLSNFRQQVVLRLTNWVDSHPFSQHLPALCLGFLYLCCLFFYCLFFGFTGRGCQEIYSISYGSHLQRQIHQLVLIDAAVTDTDYLSAHVQATHPSDTAVVVLAAGQGIAAMTEVLDRYTELAAVHIVSHGSSGRLQLGTDDLRANNLAMYQQQFQRWRRALATDADVLLYGCDVASGHGKTFVHQLSQLLQADVAASTDLTGDKQLGGNWVLEFATGKIETALAFTDIQTYGAVLKQIPVTTTADEGDGSLRWAIEQANATPDADLIELSQISGTISLRSSLPAITSDLSIVGDGDDIISGSNAQRVLVIDRGNVNLQDLTIADGLALGSVGDGSAAGMGGGLLINDGTVMLSDIRFTNNRAVGSNDSPRQPTARTQVAQTSIQTDQNNFDVNRGGIVGINGISLLDLNGIELGSDGIRIDGSKDKYRANRGAIAGVNGIGIGGIGSIAFGGGGGVGGIGNAGNGGHGGTGGKDGGNGGHGGDGGNGGIGTFNSFKVWDDQGGIGAAVFSGGSGFGGIGNAGNGGKGGDAKAPSADGGKGGSGGDGGKGSFGKTQEDERNGIPDRTPTTVAGRGGFWGGQVINFEQSQAGFGGAIFVRSGRVILTRTAFENNAAIGSTGADAGPGKGGAIFIVTEALQTKTSTALPRVIALGEPPRFVSNRASQSSNTPIDNPNIYGVIEQPER